MIQEKRYTSDKILIFDVDHTLLISTAKIEVTDQRTGKKFELTPEEFNDYQKHKHHLVNFDQFGSLEIMKAGQLINKYFNILKKNYKKGIAIGIVTARADRDMIYEFFRYHVGFHIDKPLVWAVNDPQHGLTGTIQERKKQALRWFVEQGYNDITFFDDDKNNLKLAKELDREIPEIKIKTHLAKYK